jgi:hypothetical protein
MARSHYDIQSGYYLVPYMYYIMVMAMLVVWTLMCTANTKTNTKQMQGTKEMSYKA